MVLQQAYHADQSMTIGNVEAVPLYLHCLRQAAPDLQLRGLQVWKKLLQGNMANLSAADRSALPFWEAWYKTWLLIKVTPKGVVFFFLFFSYAA